MNDFSYQGIIDHIINDGTLSKISIFFNTIIIYIIEITINEPFRNSINKLLSRFAILIMNSEVLFFFIDIISIFIALFLYVKGINKLCNKIFCLRKIFQIFDMQE